MNARTIIEFIDDKIKKYEDLLRALKNTKRHRFGQERGQIYVSGIIEGIDLIRDYILVTRGLRKESKKIRCNACDGAGEFETYLGHGIEPVINICAACNGTGIQSLPE